MPFWCRAALQILEAAIALSALRVDTPDSSLLNLYKNLQVELKTRKKKIQWVFAYGILYYFVLPQRLGHTYQIFCHIQRICISAHHKQEHSWIICCYTTVCVTDLSERQMTVTNKDLSLEMENDNSAIKLGKTAFQSSKE